MLGKQYYYILAGRHVDESGIRDIPHPTLELTSHITTKTVQAGGFLGTLVIGPIIALAKGHTDKEGIKSYANSAGTYGVGIGLLAGPLLTYARLRADDITDENIWDRCYRLRNNKAQVRSDRLSLVGAVTGVLAASYLGESVSFGALVGMNTGMLLAFAFSSTVGA